MQEKWNLFVYDLSEAKKNDVEESIYHSIIESQLQLLGWAKHKGEICHKQRYHNGNNNSLEPDILIKKDGEELFIIEVKRPVHVQIEKERQQLESYMRRPKVLFGIYIGEHIEVFYDSPNGKNIVSVLKIDLNLDEKKGAKFVELFSKENFNKDSVAKFCEERIQEMQRQESLNKIKENLMSDEGSSQIAESIKRYLTEKYTDTFSEKDIAEMLSSLTFMAVLKENDSIIYSDTKEHFEIKETQTQLQNTKKKRNYDYTQYSLNGGEPVGKGRLVLNIVKEYIKHYPNTTFSDIEKSFPSNCQGNYGVVRTLDYIRENYTDQEKSKRYFMKEDEILFSADEVPFAVSNEWGRKNIPNIIKKAKEIGFTIETSDAKPHRISTKLENTDFIRCVLPRNGINAKGIFNKKDNSLVVLKGSRINQDCMPHLKEAQAIKRRKQIIEYTEEINGTLFLKEDVKFKNPSAAALFCLGGSSNGWTEWFDEKNNKLSNYR